MSTFTLPVLICITHFLIDGIMDWPIGGKYAISNEKARFYKEAYCLRCHKGRDKSLKAPPMVARHPPIEEAYNQIKIGMKEDELMALMTPYHHLCTDHSQWQKWEEGHISVSVTVWPAGDYLARHPSDWGPFQVQSKGMSKEVFDKKRQQWIHKIFDELSHEWSEEYLGVLITKPIKNREADH